MAVVEERGKIGVERRGDSFVIRINGVSQLPKCSTDPETIMGLPPVFLRLFQENKCASAIGFLERPVFKGKIAPVQAPDQSFDSLAYGFRVRSDERVEEVESDGLHVFQVIPPSHILSRIDLTGFHPVRCFAGGSTLRVFIVGVPGKSIKMVDVRRTGGVSRQ